MSTISSAEAVKTEYGHRIAELEREVGELRSLVAALHVQTDQCSDATPRVLQQLLDMTTGLIPGEIRIESGADPEYADSPSIVFRVTPRTRPQDVDAIIDAEIEWHRAARKIFPNATCHFSLVID